MHTRLKPKHQLLDTAHGPVSVRFPGALILTLLIAALSACADTSQGINDGNPDALPADPNSVGGGGGDEVTGEVTSSESGEDPGQRTSLLSPLVGTYDLTGPWNGTPDDEALLVIRQPQESGESEVLIYDFLAEPANCYSLLPPGSAQQEPVGQRIFLDGILQFDDAVLTLSGSTLVIDYFDTFDIDRDGDAGELVTYLAGSVSLMESDIQPRCP